MNIDRMILVYIAGPYRAQSEWGLVQNIRRAEDAALSLWRAGFAVICPHKNTAHFGGACPDSVWLKGDIEMLRRCDILYACEASEYSEGARAEIEFARNNNIAVCYSIHECRQAAVAVRLAGQ